MKRFICSLIITAILILSPLTMSSMYAKWKESGSVSFVSDYIWRGDSQSNNHASVQAGLNWDDSSGLYAGVWGANINTENSSLELDLFSGYSGVFNGISYSIGGLYYYYPKRSDLDVFEYVLTAGLPLVTVAAYYGVQAPHLYLNLSSGINISNDVTLNCSLGSLTGSTEQVDVLVGVVYSKGAVSIDLSATSVQKEQTWSDTRLSIGLSRSF